VNRAPIGLLCAMVTLLSGSPLAADSLTDDERAAVDAAFADLDGTHSPGCAVGVVRGGELVYGRGYGMAMLEAGLSFDTRTRVYAGSVSKQFVAAAVLMAAGRGDLTLDDEVRRWFPELSPIADGMTVRHLIHHTSGLRDYLDLMGLAGIDFATPFSRLEALELLARQQRLNFEPGTRFLYCNSGYFLLAQMVERATGQTLRRWADETLFTPLGMHDTRFHDDRREVVPRRAAAYSPGDDGTFAVDWSPAFDLVGSGGLLTTIEDLARWDRSFWDGSLGEDFWPDLLETGSLASGEDLDYAFGLHVDQYRGVPRIAHSGAMFGYRAYLARFPEQRLTLAALCNLSTADPGGRLTKVADRLLSAALEPLTEAPGTSASTAADLPTVTLSGRELDAMAGEYELQPGVVVTLRREGHGLLASSPDVPTLTLRPIGELEVAVGGGEMDGEVLRFEREGDEIVALRGAFFGEEKRAPRLAPRVSADEELARWRGSYWSEDLGVTYRFLVEDGGAVYRIAGHPPMPLVVRADGTFEIAHGKGAVERDESGRVVAFELEAGGVQHLRFERVER
jgi:CubicO group peptidase (beta-lactamase class C family)